MNWPRLSTPSGFKYLAEGHVDFAALEIKHFAGPAGADPLVRRGGVGRGPIEAGVVGGAGVEEGFDDVGVVVRYVEAEAPLFRVLVEAVGQALLVAVTELDRADCRLTGFVGRVGRVVAGEGGH